MDPAEFYVVALRMIVGGQAPGAAQCRTAIGRACYAALNRADETLARWGASCGKGPRKHGLAVRYLHATNDPDLMTASTTLHDLKTWRNIADYDMKDASVETVHRAKLALEYAKDVMDYLEAVNIDSARRTPAEAHIKAYQRKIQRP